MRRNNDMYYGNFEDNYRREFDDSRYGQSYNQQRGNYHEPSEQYLSPQNQDYRRRGDYEPTRDDYFNQMYDIANYSGMPRDENYGLPHGPEDELMNMKPMPLQEGPYNRHRHYNYSLGYNANFDNPEEGDMYRNFDSRGNHGYRHDASYGSEDEFRDFGNDRYGSSDYTNRPSDERYRDYDRY